MTRSLLILLFLCCGALAGDGVNFAGSWDAPVNDVSAFSLDLTQTGNRITAITQPLHTVASALILCCPTRDDRPLLAVLPTSDSKAATMRAAVARQCSLFETTNWNGKSRSPLVFITFQCHLSCLARKNIHRNRLSEHKN
jgi:hypothetical protein